MSGISVDISRALQKNAVLLNIPKATRYQLLDFGDTSVEVLKRRAEQMQKGLRKTGALARSVGRRLETQGENYLLTIGTGLGSAKANRMAEKYAWIQNYGGTVHVKKGFLMTRKNWGHSTWVKKMVFQTKDKKWHMVDKVTIPPSYWFTATMDNMKKNLDNYYLKDTTVLARAKSMTGGTHAG